MKQIAINVVKAMVTGIMMIYVGIIVAVTLVRVTCQTMWTIVRGRKEKETEDKLQWVKDAAKKNADAINKIEYQVCIVCFQSVTAELYKGTKIVGSSLFIPDCPICNGKGIVKVVDKQEIVKRNGG